MAMMDPNVVMAGVAILVVVITILLKFLLRKSGGTSLLLVGLQQSGKTSLFNRLTTDTFTETVMSITENEDVVTVRNRPVPIVALPGSVRLRNQYWEKFKGRAKAVIFVVDSVSFMSDAHNVADLLYQYLSDSVITSKRIPVLVACNKQDQTRAKSSKVIAAQLEKELGTIRSSRLGGLDSTAGDEDPIILGNPDKPFKFSDLRNNIEFVDVCSTDKSKNITGIMDWTGTVF